MVRVQSHHPDVQAACCCPSGKAHLVVVFQVGLFVSTDLDVLEPLDFAVDAGSGFLQVLNGIPLESMSPEVFDGITDVEVEFLRDGDALDTAWM